MPKLRQNARLCHTDEAVGLALAAPIAASMLRDIERGAPIEADHVVGDLLQRGKRDGRDHPLLRIAFAHLKAYEARRTRELSAKTG